LLTAPWSGDPCLLADPDLAIAKRYHRPTSYPQALSDNDARMYLGEINLHGLSKTYPHRAHHHHYDY
jgi:hypothetical protein